MSHIMKAAQPDTLRRDMATRAAYTSDASIFRRVPAAVLEPRSVQEIQDGIALANERGWSIVGRGGGTSVAGNAIGEGLIIDTSRNLNRILEIDAENRTATVEPGVVCDSLRDAARPYGLTYGPDPSTHSRCTIGGMVSNNACGSHSIAYGTAADNLVSVNLMLADGREIIVDEHGCSDEIIDSRLRALFADNSSLISDELGRFPRQVSGYGLHHLGAHWAHAVAGSEGTIGIITQLKVKLVSPPPSKALAVLAFESVFDAARAAAVLRGDGVQTIEGMGGDLLAALRMKNGKAKAGENLPGSGKAGGWLYCETGAEDVAGAVRIAERVAESVDTIDYLVVSDEREMRELWSIREASAGIVTRLPDGGEAWPNWEDSAVPPENLADYLRDLYQLMAKYELQGIPFGHFGEGCVHVRLSFDFGSEDGIQTFEAFMTEASKLVSSYGGSLSGEHGDGRARSSFLKEMYSPQMRGLFEQFKTIFDPDRAFNPGVLVWADEVTEGLRMDPMQRKREFLPIHAFSNDKGSFVNAVNRCVGVSACRSMDSAMCPSFQITEDEVHSTRGRARILSEMFRGETVDETDVESSLDLCLSCKACASECPVNVDMATYKSEFLNHRYRGKIRPMAHYVMGWLPLLGHAVHKFPIVPRLVDLSMQSKFTAGVLARLGGLDSSRPLIRFSHRSLRKWARRRSENDLGREGAETVVLWPDSFSSSLDTGPAKAAIEVLEHLGFEVIVPHEFVCCGLTFHSTGQLAMTRRVLQQTARVMKPYVEKGYTVVGVEPSCTVMLQREVTELVDDPSLRALASQTKSFAEAIAPRLRELAEEGKVHLPDVTTALTQVHCHERSLGDPSQSSAVLSALGIEEDQIETGCCGLAGNWGFEKGHADMSFALGERELFPRVRECEGEIIADGFSCRTQIRQGTGKKARHVAEIVRDALINP